MRRSGFRQRKKGLRDILRSLVAKKKRHLKIPELLVLADERAKQMKTKKEKDRRRPFGQ